MGEWKYSSTILNLGIIWRWVVSFTPLPLYPRGKSPGVHLIRGWVGSRAGLDAVEKKEICFPCRESNPAIQPVSIRLGYPCSSRHLPGGTEENHENLNQDSRLSVGIGTEHLPITSLQHYSYSNHLSCIAFYIRLVNFRDYYQRTEHEIKPMQSLVTARTSWFGKNRHKLRYKHNLKIILWTNLQFITMIKWEQAIGMRSRVFLLAHNRETKHSSVLLPINVVAGHWYVWSPRLALYRQILVFGRRCSNISQSLTYGHLSVNSYQPETFLRSICSKFRTIYILVGGLLWQNVIL
jgi:hypothetical protein